MKKKAMLYRYCTIIELFASSTTSSSLPLTHTARGLPLLHPSLPLLYSFSSSLSLSFTPVYSPGRWQWGEEEAGRSSDLPECVLRLERGGERRMVGGKEDGGIQMVCLFGSIPPHRLQERGIEERGQGVKRRKDGYRELYESREIDR